VPRQWEQSARWEGEDRCRKRGLCERGYCVGIIGGKCTDNTVQVADVPSLTTISTGVQAILSLASTVRKAAVLVLLTWEIYEVSCDIASCGMIHIPSFMKIGTCVRALLRFCCSGFRGYNLSISEEKNLMQCDDELGSTGMICCCISLMEVYLSVRLINYALRHEDVRGSGDTAPSFLTSALDRDKWSTSRPGRLTPLGKTPRLVWSLAKTCFSYYSN
jgi:hypothetical protein